MTVLAHRVAYPDCALASSEILVRSLSVIRKFAPLLIWAFFLFIFSKTFEIAAVKFHSPIRPIFVYMTIAAASVVTASVALWRDRKFDASDVAYFSCFALLAAIILLGYRGEPSNPDFGLDLIYNADMPSAAGYALWPTLNLGMGLSLFVFARSLDLWRTILRASLAAFAIQIITMQVDMIWPATFGQANGRAAGIAHNANTAALIICLLVALRLPLSKGKALSTTGLQMLLVAIPALVTTNSRMGFLMGVLLATIAAVIRVTTSRTEVGSRFITTYGLIMLAMVIFSAQTRPLISDYLSKGIEWALPSLSPSSLNMVSKKTEQLPNEKLPSVAERFRTTLIPEKDASFRERASAIQSYFKVAKTQILTVGFGTGFTNKFQIGPHNMWLKLWIENGLIAAIIFTALFLTMALVAFGRHSPALGALTLIGALASLLSHTTFVEPQIFVLFAAALGATGALGIKSPT